VSPREHLRAVVSVPHSGSGVAPMSSLSGVELLGSWGFGVGGLMGEGRGK
jgi:hypothetical protein